MENVSSYTKDNFGTYLGLLAFHHLCLNRGPLYEANFKLPSFFVFGPNSTGKSSLVQLCEPILPHRLTDDNKMLMVQDNDKTIANLTDSVCEARAAVVLDPVKWMRKEDKDNLKLFNDDLYENKVKEVKAKSRSGADSRIPLTGVIYIYAGDYQYDPPDLTETLLTKNVWFPQIKCELDPQEIMDMKDILCKITTQDGKYNGHYSCLFQDLVRQMDVDEFGKEVKVYSKDLLKRYQHSTFNVSRMVENYAVLLASLQHLLKCIGVTQDVMHEFIEELQQKIEEKCIEYTLRQIAKINPQKHFKDEPAERDIVDYLCKTVEEQELKFLFMWLGFGDGDSEVYILKDFVKKSKFKKQHLLDSFGAANVDENPKAKLRSKASNSDWFYNSKIPELAYGKSSVRDCYVVRLPKCPEKFQKILLEKLNKSTGLELNCVSNIKKELDDFYRPDKAGMEVSSAQKMLAKLTPKRQKKGCDYIKQLMNDGGTTNETPKSTDIIEGTPQKPTQVKRKLESEFGPKESQEPKEKEAKNNEMGNSAE